MDNILLSVISFCETNSKVIKALEMRENQGNTPYGITARIVKSKVPYEKMFLVLFDYIVRIDQNPQSTPEDVSILVGWTNKRKFEIIWVKSMLEV